MLVSVVIPTLNELEGISCTMREIPRAYLNAMGYDTEILVIDGGSEDGTDEIARRLGAKVVFEPKRGYGRAFKTGFQHCQGEIIATLDGDCSYPACEIPRLLRELVNGGLEFVSTDRFADLQKGAMGCAHNIGNHILTLTVRILFSVDLKDSQSGMWVFKKGILSEIFPIADGMAFSEEIKIRAFRRGKSKELPIRYRNRKGKKKIRFLRDGIRNLVHLLKLLPVYSRQTYH